MYERFTDQAQKVMQLADQQARRFNHGYIGTEHILLGLVNAGSGVGPVILKKLHIDFETVRQKVEKSLGEGPERVTGRKLPLTPRAKMVVEYAMDEGCRLSQSHVGTEHILLGLLWEQEGVAAQVLMSLGAGIKEVLAEVLKVLGRLDED